MLKEAFKAYDKGSTGQIGNSHFVSCIKQAGMMATDREINLLVDELD